MSKLKDSIDTFKLDGRKYVRGPDQSYDEKLYENSDFDPNDRKIKLETGTSIFISNGGEGNSPSEGDTVSCHYEGYLEDGTIFDSSYKRNKPFEFPFQRGRVIKGWDQAFKFAKKGAKMTIIVPPEQGYGDRAQGNIPANSVLIFDVEILEVR